MIYMCIVVIESLNIISNIIVCHIYLICSHLFTGEKIEESKDPQFSLHRGDNFHEGRFQRSTAHQKSINVWLCNELLPFGSL